MSNFSLKKGFWEKIIMIALAIYVVVFIIFGVLEIGFLRVVYDEYKDLGFFIYSNRDRTLIWILLVTISILYSFAKRLQLKDDYINEIAEALENASKKNDGAFTVSLSNELLGIETIINEEHNQIEKLYLKKKRLQRISYSRRRTFIHQCKQPITSVIGLLELINEEKDISTSIIRRHLDSVSVSLLKIKDEIEIFIKIEQESIKGELHEK